MCIGRLSEVFTVFWIGITLTSCIFWIYSRMNWSEDMRVWPVWVMRMADFALAATLVAFLCAALILGLEGAHPTAQMSDPSVWGVWFMMWPILLLGLIVAFIALCISLLFSLNPNGAVKLYLARLQIFVFVSVSFVGVMENFPDA